MPASSIRPSPNAHPSRTSPPVSLWRFALAARAGDARATARAVAVARRAGWSRAALEETALMLTLYAGYPAAIEALRILHARWPGRAPTAAEVPVRARRRRGLALLDGVYGPVRPALLWRLRDFHPALAAWVVEHGYGRVLARPGLDAAVRELVTVALLACGPWERQLASHRIGARRLGATAASVEAALRDGGAVAVAAPRSLTPAGRVPKMRGRMAARPAVPPPLRASSDRPRGRGRTW